MTGNIMSIQVALNNKNNDDNSKSKQINCFWCGMLHAGVCRFINTECWFCKKIGHIERVCLSKARKARTPRVQPKAISQVEEDDIFDQRIKRSNNVYRTA